MWSRSLLRLSLAAILGLMLSTAACDDGKPEEAEASAPGVSPARSTEGTATADPDTNMLPSDCQAAGPLFVSFIDRAVETYVATSTE